MQENSFTAVPWVHTTNIYEVNIRQYTDEGTFNAFATHLPRLRNMGIETLWFMPITPIAAINRKGTLGSYYACSDYTSINPEFGTMDDFKAVVNQAHELGFKVIIDWVANHTGYGHTWTKMHPEFYNLNEHGEFYDKNGWDDVIGLNYSYPELRRAMIDAMKFWVNTCGIDGFRCDMAHLVPLDFWKQARTEIEKGGRLFWLAETEEVAYHQVFDATYAWSFLHKMEAFAKGKIGISELDEVLNDYKTKFPPQAFHALFTTNHDENSHSGSEYERYGNNALNFAVLCATWDGIPLIYTGQEAANKKRLEFFERDPVDYSGGFPLQDFYKTLLNLRITNAALRAVDEPVVTNRFLVGQPKAVFAFTRINGDKAVLVVLNLGDGSHQLNLANDWLTGKMDEVFGQPAIDFSAGGTIDIGPYEYRVYQK